MSVPPTNAREESKRLRLIAVLPFFAVEKGGSMAKMNNKIEASCMVTPRFVFGRTITHVLQLSQSSRKRARRESTSLDRMPQTLQPASCVDFKCGHNHLPTRYCACSGCAVQRLSIEIQLDSGTCLVFRAKYELQATDSGLGILLSLDYLLALPTYALFRIHVLAG
jgi:hypothetical protein